MNLEVRLLGLVDFDAAWELQRSLVPQVTPDRGFLLLLEHPPVFTLGRNGDPANVLDPHGIPVRRIDRGGDAFQFAQLFQLRDEVAQILVAHE